MNRIDLQALSALRVKEASILLQNGCFDGAYYLLGYSVECALKSCIAKQIREYDFPDKKFINDSHTHELDKLLNLSGLKSRLQQEAKENEELGLSWAVVKDWSEQFRYQHGLSQRQVQDFYDAITSEKTGILSWLKNWW